MAVSPERPPTLVRRLRARARTLKRELYALYLAMRDPRTPWHARAVAVAVLAYALSPIDLIPDFIPVIGLLDDLILVPFGIALALRLIPAPVMAEARERARVAEAGGEGRAPENRVMAVVVIAVWVFVAAGIAIWAWRHFAG